MGISVTQDIPYNADVQAFVLDMSGWDYAIAQLIDNPGYTVDFKSTNNGGSEQGSVENSAITAASLCSILATNMTDGTTASSTSGDGVFKFSDFARYIWLTSNGLLTVKVMLYKIG